MRNQIVSEPIFANVTADQLAFICEKFAVRQKPGVQPGTRQTVIRSPDGTACIFFTCHDDAEKIGVRVTITDEI